MTEKTNKQHHYSKDDWEYLKLIRAKQWPQTHPNIIYNTLGTNITTNVIYGNCSSWAISKAGLDYLRNNFITKPNDIIITSYPRSGTHWLMKICLEIIKHCTKDINTLPPEYKHADYRFIPQIDSMVSKTDGLVALHKFTNRYDNIYKSQKLYFTHMPFHLFPAKQINKSTKIIHIVRDPKDVVVSHYKFMVAMNKKGLFPDNNVKFNDLFDLFMNGYTLFGGNYWDSYISYYLELQKNQFNILWVFYENILLNPYDEIYRIGKFLCVDNGNKSLDGSVLDNDCIINKIASLCDFQILKQNANKGWKSVFRKGTIGDWKNYLNKKQQQKMDQTTKIKFNQMNDCLYYKEIIKKENELVSKL